MTTESPAHIPLKSMIGISSSDILLSKFCDFGNFTFCELVTPIRLAFLSPLDSLLILYPRSDFAFKAIPECTEYRQHGVYRAFSKVGEACDPRNRPALLGSSRIDAGSDKEWRWFSTAQVWSGGEWGVRLAEWVLTRWRYSVSSRKIRDVVRLQTQACPHFDKRSNHVHGIDY